MDKKTIRFDASMLNVVQNCFRKAQYSFIYNLSPHEREESLEKGDLMHKLLEVYYSIRGPQKYSNADGTLKPTWAELKAAGIIPGDYKSATQTAINAGLYYATKLQIDVETSEEVIKQFKEYCEFYEHDEWNPLAVEEVGSIPIYEDDEFLISYDFKVDLIAEKGHIIAPFDHKTSKQRKDPLSLSNQFIGYCFALNCNHIVVNKIGFQKTLSAAERFQRFIFNIDNNRIEEWKQNAIWWMKLYSKCIDEDNYPMNLTSCDKYSGCIFKRICEADPMLRDYKMTQDFSIVEKWDVAKSLVVPK